MKKTKGNYGLFTTVAMIVGICIGSGIFFKSDNILVATGGSVLLGVAVFLLSATGIIFGGLCISELASRTDKPGGLITYMEEFSSQRFACGMGWFQIFIYYPTITAVVAWVVGIYTCLLFGWQGTLELQMGIGLAYLTFSFVLNWASARLGGWFQSFATVSKMVPLALIAIFGLIFGNPAEGFRTIPTQTLGNTAWLAAVGPVAYSFDGWTISTSIAPEIRESKKNLPRALVMAPIFVLLAYVFYFVGVSSYLGPQKVMEMQDAHVYAVADKLLGGVGGRMLLVFVIIAVMGTVNGVVLGYIRLPYSMALRGSGMFPFASKLVHKGEKAVVPLNSALVCYGLTVFWSAAHYLTTKNNWLPNSDVSEISIVMSYLFYIILYYQVFRLYCKGEIRSGFRGIFVPIMATLGSIFILSGGMQSRLFVFYAAFCLVVVLLSFLYYNRHTSEAHRL